MPAWDVPRDRRQTLRGRSAPSTLIRAARSGLTRKHWYAAQPAALFMCPDKGHLEDDGISRLNIMDARASFSTLRRATGVPAAQEENGSRSPLPVLMRSKTHLNSLRQARRPALAFCVAELEPAPGDTK